MALGQSRARNGRLSQRSDGAHERQSSKEAHRSAQLIPTTPSTDTMASKYAFNAGLKELRFLFCQTSEHSAATRYGARAERMLHCAQHGARREYRDRTEADERKGTSSSAATPP